MTVINTDHEPPMTDGSMLKVAPQLLEDLSAGGNVRKSKRNPEKYAELKSSIAKHGVTQPVTVRPNKFKSGYELISGYGRRAASIELGLSEIPVLVRVVDDATALTMAVEENMNREDMSVLDELKYAVQITSIFDGDYGLAAKTIGWSTTKLQSRLQLNKATKPVLAALEDGDITVGHATLLSVLSETIQNNTLVKIIAEKWSVNTLKGRIKLVQNPLEQANFNTSDCDLCPHNSDGIQSDIFSTSTGVQKGLCNNAACFQLKTNESLEVIRAELEERVGTVILLTETAKERNTVSSSAVGDEQFNSGCMGCTNRVTVLDNRIGYGANAINNQCIDTNCYQSIIDEMQKSKEVPVADSKESPPANNETPEKASESKKTVAKKTIKTSLSNPLKAAIRGEIRSIASTPLLDNTAFVEAVKLVAIAALAGEYTEFSESDLKDCLSLSLDDIATKQSQMVEKYIKNKSASERYIIDCYRSVEPEQDTLKQLWKPTKATLNLYTTSGLVGLAKSANFDAWYESQNSGKKLTTFNKLAKKKGDLIEALLNPDFSWDSFTPNDFLTIKSA